MKNYILTLVLGTLCSSLLSAQTPTSSAPAPAEMKQITHEQITMMVPASWDYIPGPEGVKFTLIIPQDGDEAKFRSNMNVNYMPLPGQPTRADLEQMRDAMLDQLKSYFPDIALMQTTFGVFGGAMSMDLAAESSSLNLHWDWRIFTHGDLLYIITSTTSRDQATAWWNSVQTVLGSSNIAQTTPPVSPE
jgi:hypothetical protein